MMLQWVLTTLILICVVSLLGTAVSMAVYWWGERRR